METHLNVLKLKPKTINPARPKLGDVSSRAPGFQNAHTTCRPNKKYLEIDVVPWGGGGVVKHLREG